jgi:peroxiredoxin
MSEIKVGQVAPPFTLASGQGPAVSLANYQGRSHVILWFTKGMGCPFCRSQMSQLARGESRLKALGAEIVQVTHSPVERAAFYVQRFRVPFTYLCDHDYAVHRQWGLDVREHSLAWYAGTLVSAVRMPKPTSDLGDPAMTFGDIRSNLRDSDTGLFVIDRGGVVRSAMVSSYMTPEGQPHGIPTVDELAKELERLG